MLPEPSTGKIPYISAAWHPSSSWGLTFVLGSEFAHLSWEGLVELMLPWNQGFAQGCLIESENA